MSAYVLLNLLNEMGKRDNMRGLYKKTRIFLLLSLCMLGNFACFCCHLAFCKINFLKKIFQGHS